MQYKTKNIDSLHQVAVYTIIKNTVLKEGEKLLEENFLNVDENGNVREYDVNGQIVWDVVAIYYIQRDFFLNGRPSYHINEQYLRLKDIRPTMKKANLEDLIVDYSDSNS
jgi:hypothetical protein